MRAIEKIEEFFKMPFEKIISDLHWKDGLSLFELSKRCGFSRDCFQKEAKKLGLPLMSHKDAALRKYDHHTHWATGLRKETSSFAKMHSERMKRNNPAKNLETRKKMSESLSKYFKNNLFEQESKFKKYLDALSIKYEMQYVIDVFIVDFFIGPNFCIEVDSSSKWCKEKRKRAENKDKILLEKEYKILRINKDKLDDELFITISILDFLDSD